MLFLTAARSRRAIPDRLKVQVRVEDRLGCDARSELAVQLGARVNDIGELIVDAHCRTSVPGMYAAGDVVDALNQMSVATGQAAIAATDIHNELAGNRS